MFLLFLQKLQAREKDLESSRKETEKKLADANFETQQVCPAHRILSVSDEKKTWKWKNAFLNPEDSTLEPIMRQVAKNLFDLKQKSTRIICLIIHNDSLRAYSCYNCIKFALLVAAFFFFFLFFFFLFFFFSFFFATFSGQDVEWVGKPSMDKIRFCLYQPGLFISSISIFLQVSENLREAQEWFKTKFGNLQAELARSR